MLNKIYLIVLAAALLVMAFFTYYSWSWLQSIGSPLTVIENYDFHAGISWVFLWISAAVLLLLGNAILWSHRKSWAMWVTGIYFVVLVLVKYFWLDPTFFTFKKTNGLAEGGLYAGPFLAVVLSLMAAAIVFFDQFIVVRLSEKMHPKPAAEIAVDSEASKDSE